MSEHPYHGPERRRSDAAMGQVLSNISEAFGKINANLEMIRQDIRDIKEWQYRHDGQGDATTHAAFERRLRASEQFQNRTTGGLAVAVVVWESFKAFFRVSK